MPDREKGIVKKAERPKAVAKTFADPALAKYHAFLEMRKEKKVLENSLLITLLVFTALFFVVFPEFAARIIGNEIQGEVIEVRKQTVIQQAEPEEQQFREVRTERRELNFAQVPDFSRPTGEEQIVEDITDLDLEVRDEVMDDLMLGGLPDSAPGPILVAGNIEPPVYIARGQVPYPKKAEILRREGRVKISVIVTRGGTLEDIEMLEERPPDFGFGDAALQFLRQCEWRPARQNNKPIYAKFIFYFNFTLRK